MESLNFEKKSVILLDVAGTTTAINFVENTLYPYVLKNVEEFLKDNWEDENVKKAVAELNEENLDAEKTSALVKSLTEKNDSNVGVKSIQGLLYKKGYETGELKAHVFSDVPKCLESWHKLKKIAIFSTGSIESQELLFKNTVEGDLTPHIHKYFDQSTGVKTEAESYKKIAEVLEVPPQNILFITDDLKEAQAAKSAEIVAALIKREGNAELPEDSSFIIISSFDELPTIKRKIEEETTEAPPSKVAKVEEPEAVKEKPDEPMEVTTETKEEEVKESITETESTVEKTEETAPTNETETKTETETPAEKTENDETKTVETPVTTDNAPEATDKKPEETLTDSKMETDNAETQTKTETNECEVQTTISIKADKNLPAEEIKEKLTKDENGVEEKENKSELANGNSTEEKDEKVETKDDEVQKTKIEEPIEPTPTVPVVA